MREMTLGGFIAHLSGAAMAIEHETHKALDRAAKIVQDEAKREIGTYQGAAGPFAAWPDLAESTVAEKERLGYAPPDNPLLREGDMRDSIERAVGHHEAAVGSNSEVAVYQELGTSRIPARSFLGGAAFRKAPQVARILGAAPVIALVGEGAVERLIEREINPD